MLESQVSGSKVAAVGFNSTFVANQTDYRVELIEIR
jgi:hypothetical protein